MKLPLSLVAFAILASSCAAPSFSVEPRYGRLDASGDVAVTTTGNPVVENSLDDIGIGGGEAALGLRADVKFGSPHLTLATESAEWSGTGLVTNFGGIAGANVAVDSEMELAVHRLLLTFDVLPVPLVELGLGFGVSAVDVRAEAVDQFTSTKEEIDEVLPIPVLAVRAGVHFWRVDLEALVGGMSIDMGGDQATYLDAEVAGRLKLFDIGPVDSLLSVGYRWIDLDAEYEDGSDAIDVDATFDGLYFGLRFSI